MRILGSALVAAAALVGSSLVAAAPATAADESRYVARSEVIGTSHQGRPIKAYFRGDPKATHVLLVLGQMHGNEKAGRTTASYLVRHRKPKAGTAMWIVPTMNPDGHRKGTRTNARGVDLNRNWPTSGWTRKGKGTRTWGGRARGSERETKAMMRFLKRVKPDYIASIHQPYGVIGKSSKDRAWHRRLATELGLKLKALPIGPSDKVSPTLTGWYNRYYGKHGTATTIEYRSKPSTAWAGKKASRAIMTAARVR